MSFLQGNETSGSRPSVWTSTAVPPRFSSLAKNLETDVCVVGAGIAGLTTAYFLLQEGKAVVVLEDGALGSGETGRTTGHLSNALDDRYSFLEKRHGQVGAVLAAESHTVAIDQIERIVRKEKIDCDFERLDGYLFALSGQSPKELEDEIEAAHRAGLTQVRWADRVPFPSHNTGRCLVFPRQAQFHALKYLAGLAAALQENGVQIYTDTHVAQVQDGSPCRVRTRGEHTVSCQAVVVATNTPVNDRVMIHTKQAAYRTYVIGSPVPKGSVPRILAWDTVDPYHYVRLHPLSEASDLLIIGGEDHKTGQEADIDPHYHALEAWSRERFPEMGAVEYAWSGQVMEPVDGLAFIGRNPGDANVYIATGDSGNGLTHGTIAGILITDLIQGRDNPWAGLYDPSRKNIRSAPDFLKENLNVLPQYTDWVKRGDVESADDIAPGCGAVLRRGATKVAAYRDAGGDLFECSAVCPHLGAIVRWNDSEKTWDCPAHGSRFDPYGDVVNGPANSPLKPLAEKEEPRPLTK